MAALPAVWAWAEEGAVSIAAVTIAQVLSK
jgi:hypothetical protein